MNTISILPDKLKDFNYYKNKLPLYLQNSYGFIEHFRIWYDMYIGNTDYNGIVSSIDVILNLLNIFDEDYLEYIAAMPETDVSEEEPYGTKCDILDKIGNLFGVQRVFSCTYIDEYEQITEELTLNNAEFLILIRGQIIKNYCEGTYSQIEQYYNSTGLKICITTSETDNAEAHIYLVSNEDESYSENIRKMFLAGLLRIESMGIRYLDIYSSLDGILRWDSGISNEVWDEGVWSR